MSATQGNRIAETLETYETDLLADWLRELKETGGARTDLIRESELREQCATFLSLLRAATSSGDLRSLAGADWNAVREFLGGISRSRALQGFSPSDTMNFILSFKQPLFQRLRQSSDGDTPALIEGLTETTRLLDRMGIFTMEAFQKSREEVIARQQEELLELSTPVVKLWDGILALPMIGTLDSARTQVVMESLLQKIVETGCELAIIDITGVPTVDTLVAQHLLKTVAAARLMGAECIISGIRPQIAQTIVHLAIDLSAVTTRATLADAFLFALQRSGRSITVSAAKS